MVTAVPDEIIEANPLSEASTAIYWFPGTAVQAAFRVMDETAVSAGNRAVA